MYEIIYVDGWPAFRKPDGSIRPFIAGAEDPTGGDSETPDPLGGDSSKVKTATIGGALYQYDPETKNWFLKIPAPVAPTKPATFDYDIKTGLIIGSNGVIYVPDETQTGGKRPATNEEIAAARRAATTSGTAGRTMFPEELALLEAQTAAQRAGIAQNDLRIQQDAKRLALEQQNAAFTQARALWADARDDKRLAMEANRDLFTQQNSIANLQMNIAQMQQRRAELQTNLDWNVQQLNTNAMNEAARFNAQMGFNVEQANVAAEQRRQEQLQSLARDISEAAKAPGDYGKLAALTLANAGWGAPGTAIGKGADLRTTQSLAPLESQLRTRQDVMAQPARPFSYTPITPTMAQAPVVAPLDLSMVKVPQINIQQPSERVSAPVAGGDGSIYQPTGVLGALVGALQGGASSESVNAALNAAIAAQTGAPTGYQGAGGEGGATPAAAKGGMMNGAYISGERGPELNIPLGDQTLVLNQKQLKAAGIDLKKLMSGSKKPEQFADGGIFDAGWGNVQDQDRTLSMQFLNDALARARAGTPFQEGALPAPVYASTPGFSPLVTQVLGSLTSMAQGVPTEYFQELAAKYRPSGIRESVTQRSA
jgi:hypothetical protein